MHSFVDIVIDDASWAPLPEVLDIDDVALIVRKERSIAYRWMREGIIPAHKIGAAWILYKETVRYTLENPDEVPPLPEKFLATFPDDLSIEDLERLFGRERQAIYRWLKAGLFGRPLDSQTRIQVYRSGHTPKQRAWLVLKSDVVKLLQNTTNHPPHPPKDKSTSANV